MFTPCLNMAKPWLSLQLCSESLANAKERGPNEMHAPYTEGERNLISSKDQAI